MRYSVVPWFLGLSTVDHNASLQHYPQNNCPEVDSPPPVLEYYLDHSNGESLGLCSNHWSVNHPQLSLWRGGKNLELTYPLQMGNPLS